MHMPLYTRGLTEVDAASLTVTRWPDLSFPSRRGAETAASLCVSSPVSFFSLTAIRRSFLEVRFFSAIQAFLMSPNDLLCNPNVPVRYFPPGIRYVNVASAATHWPHISYGRTGTPCFSCRCSFSLIERSVVSHVSGSSLF
jgi:hypothetical protein